MLGNEISRQNAAQELEEGRVNLQNGEEEQNRDANAEEVTQSWVGGRHSDKEASKGVGNQET